MYMRCEGSGGVQGLSAMLGIAVLAQMPLWTALALAAMARLTHAGYAMAMVQWWTSRVPAARAGRMQAACAARCPALWTSLGCAVASPIQASLSSI